MIRAKSGDEYKMHKPTFPTLNHVWIFAAISLIALRPLLLPIAPHDFWWHMAMGREIIHTSEIPTTDSFSYTRASEPFFNQGWLAQVLMYGIYQLGGVPLILVVQAIVLALAYGMLLWLCIHRSSAVRLSVGLLLLLTLPLSFNNWNVRPQSYCFPIFAAFLIILTTWRLGHPTPRLWLLPLLMILWVNLHGSFVLGGILIALTFVGVGIQQLLARRHPPPGDSAGETAASLATPVPQPALRSLLFWGALTAAAMLINPRGLEVLAYVRGLLGTSAIANLVVEWAPPTTRDAIGRIFFLFLLFGIAILAYARRRPDPVDMLLSGAFLWLALGATRHIVWFGMVSTPLLIAQAATWLTPRPGTPPQREFTGVPALNATLMGLLGLLLVLGLPWIKPHLGLPPDLGPLLAADTPVQAVAYLQSQPERPSRLFHMMGAGSYLIWAAPEQPVFIDTRIELYPYQQWLDYINLNAGNDAPRLLTQYQIDALLLDNEQQAALLALVRADPTWVVQYEDERNTYLVRRGRGG